MYILIQTRKNIYHISRKGVRKVQTVDWKKVESLFNTIQTVRANTIAGNLKKNPAVAQLDGVISIGYKNASYLDRKIRNKAEVNAALANQDGTWKR